MNSVLCWFWCCVKACPGSCSKYPDLWCFEFHWWKPAGCVDVKANTFPKRNALWNPLAAVTSSSLPWEFNYYVNQESDQIPEAMYWVWIPGISTAMVWCLQGCGQILSEAQYLLELRYLKCQAGTELLPASSPDVGNITEAPCSGSMSMQGDFRHK